MRKTAPDSEKSVQAPPGDHEVRAELDRILSSPMFQRGGKRLDFLRYIVEETLQGRADDLKGYTIAVDVLDRDKTFDGASDPVVRLEARRLRRDLDGYYFDAGSSDPVRISIPKGAYVPHFEWRHGGPEDLVADDASEPGASAPELVGQNEPPARPRAAGRVRLAVAAGACLFVAVALAAVLATRSDESHAPSGGVSGPVLAKVVVLPFEAIDGSKQSRSIAAGLDSEAVLDLRRFNGLRLFQPPRDAALSAILGDLGEEGQGVYLVRGDVISEGMRSAISVRLLDGPSGEVIWSDAYELDHADGALMDLRDKLGADIATALGQPYGPIGASMRSRSASADPTSVDSHLCVLRAYGYRRAFSGEDFGPTLACLEQAVERDPGYADAWAMLGWLQLDDGLYGFSGGDQDTLYAKAMKATERALALDPDNVLALKAASSVRHYMGRYEESVRLSRRAIELNPYDPDVLVLLGWRLAVRGNFAEGIPLLEQAIDLSVDPPGWYFHWIALHAYIEGDYVTALETATKAARDGAVMGQALIAMSAAKLGRIQIAADALATLPPDHPLIRDPVAEGKKFGATDEIADAFAAGLREAAAFVEQATDR